MKVVLDINEDYDEDIVVIKAKRLNKEISVINNYLVNLNKTNSLISLYKDNSEYFIDINSIIFFETEDYNIYAHTIDDSYLCRYRLYELENILPSNFLRISKSSIANINNIVSIDHNFASSSLIKFNNTYKEVYVSRRYYKLLKDKLIERRL